MGEQLKIYHLLSLCKNTHRKDLSFNKKHFQFCRKQKIFATRDI